MPFITKERRKLINQRKIPPMTPGDRCYYYYKLMVDMWKENPRWTTAHEIYKLSHSFYAYTDDDWAARDLAWQVFFQIHVMPYERKKRRENGDI